MTRCIHVPDIAGSAEALDYSYAQLLMQILQGRFDLDETERPNVAAWHFEVRDLLEGDWRKRDQRRRCGTALEAVLNWLSS